MDQGQMGKKCSCPHHKMVPIFILLIGLVFLLKALGVISMGVANILWPILIIVIGLQKLFEHQCTCCERM